MLQTPFLHIYMPRFVVVVSETQTSKEFVTNGWQNGNPILLN